MLENLDHFCPHERIQECIDALRGDEHRPEEHDFLPALGVLPRSAEKVHERILFHGTLSLRSVTVVSLNCQRTMNRKEQNTLPVGKVF